MIITVLVPRTSSDRAVLDQLAKYVGAGIMRRFMVLELPDRARWIDDKESWIDDNGSDGSSPIDEMVSNIGGVEALRVICFSASSEQPEGNFARDVGQLRRTLSIVSKDVIFGGVYGCRAGETMPATLFAEHNRYFNFNLVLLPEESLGETGSRTRRIRDADVLHEAIASVIALVGAIWIWLERGPLDDIAHSGHGDLQRIRLVRTFTRVALTEDVVSSTLAGALGGGGKSLRPRGCVPHTESERAIDELCTVLIPEDGASPIGFSFRPLARVSEAPKPSLGILEALKLFWTELQDELLNVPRITLGRMRHQIDARVKRVEKRIEKITTDGTFGSDSRIVIKLREASDLSLAMDQAARSRELDRLSDLEHYGVSATPNTWKILTNAVLSAADGGDAPAALKPWEGLRWQGQRAVVTDLELLAPNLGQQGRYSTDARPHDVQVTRARLMSAEHDA